MGKITAFLPIHLTAVICFEFFSDEKFLTLHVPENVFMVRFSGRIPLTPGKIRKYCTLSEPSRLLDLLFAVFFLVSQLVGRFKVFSNVSLCHSLTLKKNSAYQTNVLQLNKPVLPLMLKMLICTERTITEMG